MTTFTATFANGTTVTRTSKTKVYTHAFNITRNGEKRGTFFASDLAKAQKACANEIARLTRVNSEVGGEGLEFEIVATVAA